MADNAFPKAIYKRSTRGAGDAEPVWDLGYFLVSRAEDQDAVDAALADGWTLNPADEPAAPKPIRSKPIAQDPAPVADTPSQEA